MAGKYLPGTTDNYCSNEVIVAGLTTNEIWPYLSNPFAWPKYYSNSSDIKFINKESQLFYEAVRFRFKTFGFPIEAQITEFVKPEPGLPARLA